MNIWQQLARMKEIDHFVPRGKGACCPNCIYMTVEGCTQPDAEISVRTLDGQPLISVISNIEGVSISEVSHMMGCTHLKRPKAEIGKLMS